MKRIAIFCDGTWNRDDKALLDAEGRSLTNIYHLREALSDHGADGVPQHKIYVDGVGTPDAGGLGSKARFVLDKFGGGAFGWGLDGKILKAYDQLVDLYEPGDQIYMFGFSRGAFTARSLVGLIRNCGLPRVNADGTLWATSQPGTPYGGMTRAQFLRRLMEIYRSRKSDDAPEAARARWLRQLVNPDVITHRDDHLGHLNAGSCTYMRIAYLGIFDTVKALGLPEVHPSLARFNTRYQFHDAQLSAMVQAARHAIAIDEPRVTYKSVPWSDDSIDWLNARAEAGGVAPVQQKWFPGVHGTIGGSLSGAARGLGNATLDWIAQGAEAAGLCFAEDKLAPFRAPVQADGPFMNPGQRYKFPDTLTNAVVPYARPDVEDPAKLTDLARERWFLERTGDGWPYRPQPLLRLAKDLGWPGPYTAPKLSFWQRYKM